VPGSGSELGPFDWKREVFQMLVRQGPAFLLLALVLYGIFRAGDYAMSTAIPTHLQSIKDGYKEIAGQMERSVDKIASAIDKDAARDAEQNKAILAELKTINSDRNRSDKPKEN
jgi:hypothetical protein